MIRFDRVSVTYADADRPALCDAELAIGEGELCVVIGGTGSGKSTLLGAVNGVVPRFTGGTLTGRVTVGGVATDAQPPRELAGLVGVVGQDPVAGFVTDTVEEELAYVMENLGVAPDAMRRRVEDVLDLLNLHPIRRRPLRTLSGGQAQRVAIGSVLTASPRVLVLDEPTSALDPAAAEDVLAAMARLVHDLGLTVIVAEHRLERVLPFADRVIEVRAGVPPRIGEPAAVVESSALAPPVVELGRLAGWSPLPLTVRDARRRAGDLRAALASAPRPNGSAAPGGVVATVRRVGFSYGPVPALHDVDLALAAGQVTAVMGRNGSGKSTLLALLAGLRPPAAGRVRIGEVAPDAIPARERVRRVGLVPQDPSLLLEADSVARECALADRDGGRVAGTTRAVLDSLVGAVDDGTHPRDLSEGQRLALALALVLADAPPVVLLDEPTRGLDYGAKHRLAALLRELAAAGHAVVIATHDVEVVARAADRAVVLAEGEVVADGPAREVVSHSPVFAPQVAKVLAPEPWLTVDEVARGLAAVGGGR